MSTVVQTNLPDVLWYQAQLFLQQGRVETMQDLITESLRCYLESHTEDLIEPFILEDVQWGLHGKE